MAVGFVKSCKTIDDNALATVSATFSQAVAAGNALAVGFTVADNNTTATISDNAAGGSNTYTKAAAQYDATNNQCLGIWYALNLKSSEALTVTASFSSTSGFARIIVCEYSGVATASAADGTSMNIAVGTTGTDAITSNGGSPPTTTASGDLLVGAIVDDAGTTTITPGTNFTERDSLNAEDTEVEDRTLSGTASAVATWTFGLAHRYLAACLALKAFQGSAAQSSFRFRNDDGSESAATWLASEAAGVTQPLNTNTRLRVQVDTTGDTPATAYQLEYRKSTDANYARVLAAQPVTVLPTFVARGAFNSGTAALTVTQPAGIQSGDLLLLFVETANQAMTTPTGWTQVTNSPQSTGTAAAAGGVRLTVFYKVAGASESSVSLADSGDHQTAIIMAFRGVDNTTPFNITAGKIDSTASTAVSCPAVTTTQANCLIVNALALDADLASTTNLSAVANSGLSGVTLQHTQTVIAGAGGGLAVITGGKAVAGSTGATTATDSTSEVRCYLTMALNPTPVSPVPILLATSANISAGAGTATTAQLTPPSGKTTASFQAGLLSDDTNPLPSIDLGAAAWTELEWCLQAVSPAVNGDLYQFRVTAGGSSFATYAVTPQWTVGTAGGGPATSPAAILGHL